jgi:hypothetical protein
MGTILSGRSREKDRANKEPSERNIPQRGRSSMRIWQRQLVMKRMENNVRNRTNFNLS